MYFINELVILKKWVTQMSKILFTPGPTNVPEEIRQVLGQDLIHHRMADYHQLLKEINEDLKSCL